MADGSTEVAPLNATGVKPAPHPLVRALEILAVAALYAGAGRLGVLAAIPPGLASPIWPSSGIALAAVLLRGSGIWPGIWMGSFLLNNWIIIERSRASLEIGWITTASIATGTTLGSLLGAHLLRRQLPSGSPFTSAQGVVRFVVLSAVLASMVSSTVGTTSLCLGGVDVWSNFGPSWLTWWLGDVAGVLVVTPLLLTWSKPPKPSPGPHRVGETLAFVVLLVLANAIGFFGRYPLSFTVIPILVWAALRFGQHGSTAAIFVVSAFAIAGAVVGLGPFVRPDLTQNESLLVLEAFMGVLVLTTLLLAALITEREQANEELVRHSDGLERRVAERTRDLEAANRELEAFAHAVSHDIRSPLTIISMSVELLEGSRDSWAERERESLELIRSASERMVDLTGALLDLSLAQKCEPERRCVDLSALARDVQAALEKRDPERRVTFAIPEGLAAQGDERLLRIALENLLGNAWKFTGERAHARIEVGRVERDGRTVFFVRDDGVGFDMAGAGNLFRTFSRLHPMSEFPGSGIGLSTVSRIVERHGGRIWAEAEVGHGATFYFSL